MTNGITNQQTQDNAVSEGEEKQRLLACVEKETENFKRAMQQYYAKPQQTKADFLIINRELVAAIDRVIAAEDWEKSLFLRNTIKPLLKIREEAQALQIELSQSEQTTATQVAVSLSQEQVKIYISLYQAEGLNLDRWEQQLRSIEHYVQGRPIYSEEENIQAALRAKLNQAAEAYVVVVINRASVVATTSHSGRVDRFGHSLLTLLPGAVKPERILEFVHMGMRYSVQEGSIIRPDAKLENK